ncbi:hypothetical protein QFC20_005584 [Naganishia adeliensis]|uniref:Uncharacterized protein n=1 Tax=Naganishia adeliensis TaxID=92952 RepID=A0ACC2VKW3_9TREE|nr:hypothetical protein QFC20_005584 [Naganishia adeliensis]
MTTGLDEKKIAFDHVEDAKALQRSDSDEPSHDLYSSVRPRRTSDEKQAQLKAAQAADPGLHWASMRALSFLGMILVVCCCGGDTGLDATIFGIYTIGGVVASLPGSYLPDKFGRRWAMVMGNVVLLIGSLLSANATNMKMFTGGRFLTGLGCTTAALSSKSYMAEITSPNLRGRCMGLLNSFYYIGQILASGIAVPTGRRADNYSWRLPLFVQLIFPAVNIAGKWHYHSSLIVVGLTRPMFLAMYWMPESPRWIYSRGDTARARRILADLHSRDRDINSPLIAFEIEEIEESISLDGSDKRWWDFRKLVNTGRNRYRLGLCFMVSVYGQLSGNGLITYFLTILLAQAGIKSQDRILTLNFVNSVTSFIGALTGTAVVDRVGRRKLMLFACICCTIGMSIVAGLLSPSGPQTTPRAEAGVTFIYLFMVFFSLGWTPLQGLYPTEVLAYEPFPQQVRAKGLAVQSLATQSVSCINTFGMPIALAKLQWKTYIIFAVFDFIGIFVIYFAAVETKQIPLEQMDEIFNAKSPRKYSLELAAQARIKAKAAQEATRA